MQVSWQEYCRVAREHTARLTDDQCKEIIKLMDEGTRVWPLKTRAGRVGRCPMPVVILHALTRKV